jgi:hypothetical protein
MSEEKKYTRVGQMLRSKDKDKNGNDSFYLKFERAKDKEKNYKGDPVFPLTLQEGETLALFEKTDGPDFILFDVVKVKKDGKTNPFTRRDVTNESEATEVTSTEEIPF